MKVVVKKIAPSTTKARNASDGRWYYSPVWLEFEEEVKKSVGTKRVPEEWKYFDVTITVDQKNRRGKLACRLKTTLDALTHAEFWKDDRQVAKITIKYGTISRDRTTIEVKEAKEKWQKSKQTTLGQC